MIATFLISRLMRPLMRLAIVGTLVLAAMPANAEYMGGGSIYAPYNCSWPVNTEMTRARYVPLDDGTATPSTVTLNFAVGGVNTYTFRGDLSRSNSWLRMTGRSVWGGLYFMNISPQVRVLMRSNALYRGDTDIETDDNIRLRLRIRNFNGESGCSVTVALMLHRWD